MLFEPVKDHSSPTAENQIFVKKLRTQKQCFQLSFFQSLENLKTVIQLPALSAPKQYDVEMSAQHASAICMANATQETVTVNESSRNDTAQLSHNELVEE